MLYAAVAAAVICFVLWTLCDPCNVVYVIRVWWSICFWRVYEWRALFWRVAGRTGAGDFDFLSIIESLFFFFFFWVFSHRELLRQLCFLESFVVVVKVDMERFLIRNSRYRGCDDTGSRFIKLRKHVFSQCCVAMPDIHPATGWLFRKWPAQS